MSGARRLKVLAALGPGEWDSWRPALETALKAAGIEAELAPRLPPDEVDYILYTPSGGLADFTPFTRLKAVLSLWAGVERIVSNPTLTRPLTRMVDPGLRAGMREWVVAHVLALHLGLARDICRPAPGWEPRLPPLAGERQVGILGLGELGRACARALAGLGFRVAGWSRRAREMPGIESLTGPEGLRALLGGAEFLILLLPLTQATENILNAETLALLPPGAAVLNPGRGALIDDAALLAALDSGRLSHAVLDVFRAEPLPESHPFWRHPRLTVTPHLASATRPGSAAGVVAENIRRAEAGEELLYRVDRARGY